MPDESYKTRAEIINNMANILQQEQKLLDLYRQTNDRAFVNEYQELAAQFHELHKSLHEPKHNRFTI